MCGGYSARMLAARPSGMVPPFHVAAQLLCLCRVRHLLWVGDRCFGLGVIIELADVAVTERRIGDVRENEDGRSGCSSSS
jgi:hypothetical protein